MTEKQIQLAGYLTKEADLTEGRLSFIASIEQPDREGDGCEHRRPTGDPRGAAPGRTGPPGAAHRGAGRVARGG